MPDRIPEISSSSIILMGSFNPKIFQPEWFGRQGLLPQPEVDSAEVKIIAQQICHFETERIIIQVMEGRFAAVSKPNSNAAPLRDLVQGTFYILEHTPAVTAMGLNRQMHFPIGSESKWHQIGDKLAPKEGWNGVLEGRPGMLSLSILAERVGPPTAKFTVKVEPSLLIKFGVYFETNEHYQAPEAEPLKSLMKTLGDKWEETQTHASRVANHILSWAGADN
jgi:hypothetical protein